MVQIRKNIISMLGQCNGHLCRLHFTKQIIPCRSSTDFAHSTLNSPSATIYLVGLKIKSLKPCQAEYKSLNCSFDPC